MGNRYSKLSSVVLFLALLFSPVSVWTQDQVLTIREWKGLSTKISSYDLSPEYATEAKNLRFSKIGSLQKRFSRSKYNSGSLGNNPITFITRFYYGTNKKLVIGYLGTLKVGDDGAGTFSNIKTELTSGLRFSEATYKDKLYLGNGTDTNQRYDGTNIRDMGCPIPASAPSMAEGAAGVIGAGTYKGKVTYLYDGYQESNGCSSDGSVTITADKRINWSAIPTSADGAVTKRKLYRTTAGGSIFYYLTTINDNTTTTYEDNTPDGDLSGTTIPTDHDIPPNFKYICLVKERLFLVPANSSYIYYTKIADVVSYPDIVPATNYIPVSVDDGDIITGIAIDPLGTVTVFKQNSIRKLFIEGSPTEWSVSESFSSYGCTAPYSITESPYGIIYLYRSGDKKEIRVFDGQTSKVISERIEPTLADISDSYILNATGIYHEGKYYLAYTDRTTGVNHNNRVLVIDLLRDAFSIDTKNINVFCFWKGSGDWGQLYSGDSVNGYVRREDTSIQDIYHRIKSDLDSGTYDKCVSSGTEEFPEVKLVTADLINAVGAQVANTLTTYAASTYSGEDDTAWPSGDLKSAILEINAKELKKLYWTEDLGTQGDITFQIRTGDTKGAVEAASWSSKFSDPGSDISGETAAKYIQYQARLYTEDINVVSLPKLYRSDYVLWINAGLGVIDESSIDFVYETGDLSLGSSFLTKRFRSLRTKANIGGNSYTIKYYLDNASVESGSFTIAEDKAVNYFDLNAFGETIRLRIDESSIEDFSLDEISLIYKTEPLRF